MKSFMASPSTIERKWYVVDASGHTLGRLASEVAKVLRMTSQAIRDMIKRGEISAVRVGRQYRIDRSEVERITTPTGGKP